MCCKRITQPTNIQEKYSSCYHSTYVLLRSTKKWMLNSRLLWYLCIFYYTTLFQILSIYNRFVELAAYGMGTVRWYKNIVCFIPSFNWRNIEKKIKKQHVFKNFFHFMSFWSNFLCKKNESLKLKIYLILPVTKGEGWGHIVGFLPQLLNRSW